MRANIANINTYLLRLQSQTALETYNETEGRCRRINSRNSYDQKPNRKHKKKTLKFVRKESKRAKPWNNKYGYKLDKIRDRLKRKLAEKITNN